MKTKLTRLSIGMDGDIEPGENGDLVAFSEASEAVEKLEAELAKLRAIKTPVHLTAALRDAESQFRKYANLHSEKAEASLLAGKPSEADGHKLKARANVELADKCLEALLFEGLREHPVSLAGDDFIAVTHAVYKRLTRERVTEFLNEIDPLGEFSRSQVIRIMLDKFELLSACQTEIYTEVLHVE